MASNPMLLYLLNAERLRLPDAQRLAEPTLLGARPKSFRPFVPICLPAGTIMQGSDLARGEFHHGASTTGSGRGTYSAAGRAAAGARSGGCGGAPLVRRAAGGVGVLEPSRALCPAGGAGLPARAWAGTGRPTRLA